MLDWWYQLVDALLPFQWAQHLFMKNALLAVLLATPLFGLLGTMVVGGRMAFFSDSLGHGAFTGIALGSLMGVVSPLWAASAFSVIFAVTITLIKNKTRASADTVIGVFSSTAVALGLVIMSLGGGFNKFSGYLIGDILSITPLEIALLAGLLAAVLALWAALYNRLLLTGINQALAASRGVNTLAAEMLFTSAVAIVVTVTIQWVGLLIINSLLVLPAAAARNVSGNTRRYHFISVLIAWTSGVAGLIVSYYAGTAAGATIVLVAAGLYFVSFTLRNRVRG